MKATETKSTHSQQHGAADKSSASQEQERAFFSESTSERNPFFSPAGEVGLQAKFGNDRPSFFQPVSVPSIQAKCATCEAEERTAPDEAIAETPIQRQPVFESEAEPENPVQRTPAFESEHESPLQTKPLIQRQEQSEPDNLEKAPDEEPALQTKLTIGQPGDQYEREADAVADRVVTLPKQRSALSPTLQAKPLGKTITPWVQRQVDKIQPKPLQRKPISRKPVLQRQTGQSAIVSSNLSSRLQSTRGGGSPLEGSTRSRMESAFGSDFSQVRIHTDSQAVQLNQDLGAKAFTHGSDIYFNEGQYNPNSSEGTHLLAHELTHTVQQGTSNIQRKLKISRGGAPTIQLLPNFIKRGVNWLAERTIPGYTLLNVILGKNIITGEAVERSGVNMIKGYMRLNPVIGSILLRELNETETLSEAGKWVEGKVLEFGINFNDIAHRIRLMWDEMTIRKRVRGNIRVFQKHLGPVIDKFVDFSTVVMGKVKELRFEAALRLVGATELLDALKEDPEALKKAVDDPKTVLRQFMVGALKKGFANFKEEFTTHFKDALLGWLFGKAAEMGVQVPKQFDVAGLFSLIAQLVGVTKQQILDAVVKRLGPKGQMIVSQLEDNIDFIKDLFTKGPIVLWERVKDFLGDFKEMIISQISALVSTEIINVAVTKILSMLNPAGALVQLALTLYRVIKFFIDQWETIKAVALGILNSIAMVALNKIEPAAAFVENVLAKGIKLIIDFLARIFGLSGIVDKVKALIKKISDSVKEAIDKVIDWIVEQGKKLFRKGKEAAHKIKEKLVAWWQIRKQFTSADGETHTLFFEGEETNAVLMVQSVKEPYTEFVNRARPGTDAKKIKAKEEAQRIAKLIDAKRDEVTGGKTYNQVQKAVQKRASEVKELLEELKPHTLILFKGSIPESAYPEFGTTNDADFGTSMSIKGLTNVNPPEGSPAMKDDGGNATFKALNQRRYPRNPGHSYYVKGHLLNEKLGGTGKEWDNLTPLSRSGNGQHEVQAESYVKKTAALPAIVEYTVKPVYKSRGDRDSLIKRIKASSDSPEHKEIKENIVKAEDWVPHALTVESHILNKENERRGLIFKQSILNSIDRNYESYIIRE